MDVFVARFGKQAAFLTPDFMAEISTSQGHDCKARKEMGPTASNPTLSDIMQPAGDSILAGQEAAVNSI